LRKLKIKVKDEFNVPIIKFKGTVDEWSPIWKKLKKKLK